jgi:hypothetical protein
MDDGHIKDITNVRFCVVSATEDGTWVLGDYDMTDWDEGWKVLWEDVKKYVEDNDMDLSTITVMRIDQAMDLWLDLQVMLEKDGTYNLKDYYD